MFSIIKISRIAKILNILFIIITTSCSDNKYNKHQINDEKYLKTPHLHNLIMPNGIVFRLKNNDYDIPILVQKGMIGKHLNIQPPNQL